MPPPMKKTIGVVEDDPVDEAVPLDTIRTWLPC